MADDRLRAEARRLFEFAYVPYGRTPSAAVVLLSDGMMVPGVRIENASYSLTISAAHAAVATAVSGGRTDIAAVAVEPRASAFEEAFLRSMPFTSSLRTSDGSVFLPGSSPIPDPLRFLPRTETGTDLPADRLVASARAARERAFVPASSFRVGCAAVTVDGYAVASANVEHGDWPFILCAERIAVAMAVAYGLGTISHLALSCDSPTGCTPCGACRQVLLELAPTAELWIDRISGPPRRLEIASLLPAPFTESDLDAV